MAAHRATYFDGLEDPCQGADAFAHPENKSGFLNGLLCFLALTGSICQNHLFLSQFSICKIYHSHK